MTWTTRDEYFKQVGTSPMPLAHRLNALGFSPTAPARTIIATPHDLTSRFRDRAVDDGALLKALMHNFYTYGRNHWSWSGQSVKESLNGGLIKGLTSAAACGIFNDSFEFLATNVLGIQGVKKGNAADNEGKTWYNKDFVTMPEDGIDSKWQGSVMTHNYSFSALKMYKFTGHYFCNYHGVIFDATANLTHESTKTMVAFDLVALSKDEASDFSGDTRFKTYEVKNISPYFETKPYLDIHTGRWVLIPLGLDTLIANGSNRAFGKYLLTNRSKVSMSETENFSMLSGRTSKKTYD